MGGGKVQKKNMHTGKTTESVSPKLDLKKLQKVTFEKVEIKKYKILKII